MSSPQPCRPARHWLSGLIRLAAALRREEGISLVETAISCIILLAMLFGVFQTSILIYSYNVTSNTAREATRYTIVRGSTSCANTPNLSQCNATSAQIQTFVRGLGYPGVTSSNITATTTWYMASATQPTTWTLCTTGTCNAPGNLVKVRIQYPFPLNIPFVPVNTFTLTSTSKMVISQ